MIIMKRIIPVMVTIIIMMLTGCKGSQNVKKETQSVKNDTQAETTAFVEESEAPETTDEEQTTEQEETSAPETSEPSETTAEQESAEQEEPQETEEQAEAVISEEPQEAQKAEEPKKSEPKHEHSYTESIVSATCTKEGYTLHSCSCGKSYKDNTVKALGHDYEAATCQNPKTCKRCNATSGKKAAHSYVGGDCKTKSKCKYCGLEGSYGEHQYGKETVTKEATYIEKGEKTKTCKVCGEKKTEEIPVRDASELDDATYEKMVADRTLYYINQYRIAEGAPAAKSLPNMTKYAEYRAKQLIHNFAHDAEDEVAAATALKYGEYQYGEETYVVYDDNGRVDHIVHTGVYKESYAPRCGEAIVSTAFDRGDVDGTAFTFVYSIHRSKNHWAYIGRPSNIYISVGYRGGAMDICTSDTDIYG